MKCFYHNDLDGRAAGFCVYAWLGIADGYDASFVPINYGKPFPFETIRRQEQVCIVDYSISPAEMQELLSLTSDVIWIDHHKTAIEKYVGFPHAIRGIRKDGEAGCVLTWKYLHWYTGRGDGPENFEKECPAGLEVPRCILLVGDRDTWAWKYGEETKLFHAAAQSYKTDPSSDFWWKCMEHETDPSVGPGNRTAHERGVAFWEQLMREGATVERYREHYYRDYREELAFPAEIDGHLALAMNVARVGSEAFGGDSAFAEGWNILMPFYFDGRQFTVSLYSKTVDVSEIAKKYGGGGHKGASGFQCKSLPFEA